MKTDLNALRGTSIYAEEAFVAEVQSLIETIMHKKGMTRAELAEAMGVSRPRITQMFSADCKNFTVRLLARAMHAMGERAEMTCALQRDLKRQQYTAEFLADLPRFETDWSVEWQHSFGAAANDQFAALSSDDLEVASGDGERRVENLVAHSLRRADRLRRVAA